jgi:hypothetical protein
MSISPTLDPRLLKEVGDLVICYSNGQGSYDINHYYNLDTKRLLALSPAILLL